MPRIFQRDQTCKHDNRKGISILNYEQFIVNLNNYLKDDLADALNYIKVSLASIKKHTPKYRRNLTFKSKAFDFINLSRILRSEDVCDNLPSSFNISAIPMVVYNLSPSLRSSTLLTINNF